MALASPLCLLLVLGTLAAAAPIELKPGRKQLLLDDFLIQEADGLERTMHRPTKRGAVGNSFATPTGRRLRPMVFASW